jgi:hypothetical protein
MTRYVRDHLGLKSGNLWVLNDDDVCELVRAAVEREGSQAAFAKRHRINRSSLSAFMNGTRGITAPIAKAVGLRRVWVVK